MQKKIILMMGTSARGGMATVVDNLLSLEWMRYSVQFVSTHIDAHRFLQFLHYLKSVIMALPWFFNPEVRIVHLHVSKRGSFYRKYLFLCFSKILRKKNLIHTHGGEFFEFYHNSNSLVKFFIRHFFRLGDAVCVLSKERESAYTALVDPKRIHVVPNFVSLPNHKPDDFLESDGNINLLFLGVICTRKGVDDLIRAFADLGMKNVSLIIAGTGEAAFYRKMVKDLNLGGHIQLPGWTSGAAREDLFRKADIFVLPSYQEDLPMAILEAMAYGLPIISTSVAGIPSLVIDGYNGFLISPGDVRNLTDKLRTLAMDQNLRQSMGKKSRERVEEYFDKNSVQRRLQKLYDGLTESDIQGKLKC